MKEYLVALKLKVEVEITNIPNILKEHFKLYATDLNFFNKRLRFCWQRLESIAHIFKIKIMITPTHQVPDLKLNLINDTQWELYKQRPGKYTLLVFYRGYHCPKCKQQLEELKDKLDEFTERSINVIAISMDSEERAKKTGDKWDIESIPVGYGLKEKEAKSWGLYLSESISESEPETFSEPGLFLVNPDNTLYLSSIQTTPFARPHFDDLLKAIDFIEDKGYPARGTK